jgi:hypothetical protein
MSWGLNMTTEEIMKEHERYRTQEIAKLRALARHYNAEADHLENMGKPLSEQKIAKHLGSRL